MNKWLLFTSITLATIAFPTSMMATAAEAAATQDWSKDFDNTDSKIKNLSSNIDVSFTSAEENVEYSNPAGTFNVSSTSSTSSTDLKVLKIKGKKTDGGGKFNNVGTINVSNFSDLVFDFTSSGSSDTNKGDFINKSTGRINVLQNGHFTIRKFSSILFESGSQFRAPHNATYAVFNTTTFTNKGFVTYNYLVVTANTFTNAQGGRMSGYLDLSSNTFSNEGSIQGIFHLDSVDNSMATAPSSTSTISYTNVGRIKGRLRIGADGTKNRLSASSKQSSTIDSLVFKNTTGTLEITDSRYSDNQSLIYGSLETGVVASVDGSASPSVSPSGGTAESTKAGTEGDAGSTGGATTSGTEVVKSVEAGDSADSTPKTEAVEATTETVVKGAEGAGEADTTKVVEGEGEESPEAETPTEDADTASAGAEEAAVSALIMASSTSAVSSTVVPASIPVATASKAQLILRNGSVLDVKKNITINSGNVLIQGVLKASGGDSTVTAKEGSIITFKSYKPPKQVPLDTPPEEESTPPKSPPEAVAAASTIVKSADPTLPTDMSSIPEPTFLFGKIEAKTIDISKATLKFQLDSESDIGEGGTLPVATATTTLTTDDAKQKGKVNLLDESNQESAFYEAFLTKSTDTKSLFIIIRGKKVEVARFTKNANEQIIFTELVNFDSSLKALNPRDIVKISQNINNTAEEFADQKDVSKNLTSSLLSSVISSRLNTGFVSTPSSTFTPNLTPDNTSAPSSSLSISGAKVADLGNTLGLFDVSTPSNLVYTNLIGGYAKSKSGSSYAYGIVGGIDRFFNEYIFAGAYVSYLRGNSKLDKYEISSNNIQFGIYGRIGSKLEIDTALKYNMSFNNSAGKIAINKKDYDNKSSFSTHSINPSVSVGYKLNFDQQSLKPYVALSTVIDLNSDTEGFLKHKISNSFSMDLSVGAEYSIKLGSFVAYAVPSVDIGLFNSAKTEKVLFGKSEFDIKVDKKEYFGGILLGGTFNINEALSTSLNGVFKGSNKGNIFIGTQASLKYRF